MKLLAQHGPACWPGYQAWAAVALRFCQSSWFDVSLRYSGVNCGFTVGTTSAGDWDSEDSGTEESGSEEDEEEAKEKVAEKGGEAKADKLEHSGGCEGSWSSGRG